MRKVLFKTSTISLIICTLLSSTSATIVTQRLESALTKEQNNSSTITTFGNESEISKFEEEIIIIIYPKDDNSSNIDKNFISFLEANGIPYSISESLLEICVYPNKMGQDKIKDLIDRIKTLPGQHYVDRGYPVRLMEIITEGSNAINATKFVLDGVDGRYPDGTRVKIAVIDREFKGYEELQKRGELPQDVVPIDLATGIPVAPEGDHGSKCAEIIYDLVPYAKMYLIKARIDTDVENAVEECLRNGIKIISCSIGLHYFRSFVAGMDSLDQKIDKGILEDKFLFIAAAGNEAKRSWFGKFYNNGAGYMLFPSGNNFLNVTLPQDTDVSLIWNDYGLSSDSDYRIEVFDQQNSSIEKSDTMSPGGMVRTSIFKKKFGPGKFKIRIFKKSDNSMSQGREMRLIFDKGLQLGDVIDNPADRNSESSLCTPADSRCALTVGAVNVAKYTRGPIEDYSSRGPTRPYTPKGTPGAMKPDITAPSVVSTASGGYRHFGGTSAAAPHVAGVAVLLLSLNPGLTMMELRAKVIEYTQQIQSSPDNIYGNGILVLNTDIIPPNDVGDFVCYPNPVSIGATGHIKITNLPFNTDLIDVQIYTVTGEFVKSFNAGDMFEEEYTPGKRRRMLEWDLRNQDGARIAPGVYFVTVKSLLESRKVKKIAVQI
jgi:hypothetical protein